MASHGSRASAHALAQARSSWNGSPLRRVSQQQSDAFAKHPLYPEPSLMEKKITPCEMRCNLRPKRDTRAALLPNGTSHHWRGSAVTPTTHLLLLHSTSLYAQHSPFQHLFGCDELRSTRQTSSSQRLAMQGGSLAEASQRCSKMGLSIHLAFARLCRQHGVHLCLWVQQINEQASHDRTPAKEATFR